MGAVEEVVAAAEEAIYADAADPLVNWDADDLRAALAAAGLVDVRLTVEEQTEERRITAGHLDRWFPALSPSLREGLGEGGARLSYGERLLAGGLSAAEVGKVAKLFREQLTEQTVSWRSRLAFVVGAKER